MNDAPTFRLIVAITGATGAVYGVRLLQLVQQLPQIHSHLIVSDAAWRTIAHELKLSKEQVRALAHTVHSVADVGASIASGSFVNSAVPCAMVVAPCSMKSLAAIAHGFADNLISRTADVVIKERKPLVLLVRETPLSSIHLRNMLTLSEAGVTLFPPVPAFYQLPQSLDDVVLHTLVRVLDQCGIHTDWIVRWRDDSEARV